MILASAFLGLMLLSVLSLLLLLLHLLANRFVILLPLAVPFVGIPLILFLLLSHCFLLPVIVFGLLSLPIIRFALLFCCIRAIMRGHERRVGGRHLRLGQGVRTLLRPCGLLLL